MRVLRVSLPCQECIFDVGITTLSGLVVVVFSLEIAIFAVSFLANSTRKEGLTEFQVAAVASHFRDQGSLTIGCLHLPFPCLLIRSRGGCTRRVDEVLDVDVSAKGHLVLGPGKDDYWPMLAA